MLHQYPLKIEKELFNKFKEVCKSEDRTVASMLIVLIKKSIKQYEENKND